MFLQAGEFENSCRLRSLSSETFLKVNWLKLMLSKWSFESFFPESEIAKSVVLILSRILRTPRVLI